MLTFTRYASPLPTQLPTQIRKAYRKLALRWHPDKNPQQTDVAQEKFVRLANAYEILSNAALRRVYDVNGLGRSRASAGADSKNSGFQTFQFRSAEEIFNDVFPEDEELFADFFEDNAEGNGAADDSVGTGTGSHVHRGHTEVTKTRTITRTSTVDGQQRSISRTHSTTNRDGLTLTKRAGERMTTDGRQVKTAEIEEIRPSGHRRYERRQIVDGELKHYDARLDPDRELLHPDL
jgi:DnaJ-class molecular chaperone